MAILTTIYTIAWYGVDGGNCQDVTITDLLGTYDTSTGFGDNATYSGPFADRKDELKGIEIYGYEDGLPRSFNINLYKVGATPSLTELKCGRMYFIKNFPQIPVEIPGLVPSAEGVDMGRVVLA
jgi:hypothetical protein